MVAVVCFIVSVPVLESDFPDTGLALAGLALAPTAPEPLNSFPVLVFDSFESDIFNDWVSFTWQTLGEMFNESI